MPEEKNLKFKVIIIGNAGTGKTTMVTSLLGEPLPLTYIQTQGNRTF